MRGLALAALLGALADSSVAAQRAPAPARSRADALLAVGRLAAAEDALYAAVRARPRAPEPRGALGLYLASRARFRIAEVLFLEAVRFGADSGTALRAMARMAPYRVRAVPGPVVAVPLRPAADPRSLGSFGVRAQRAARDEYQAVVDPTIEGVVLGRAAAAAFGVEGSRPDPTVRELWVGERRLGTLAARVDSLASPHEMRVGLDVLWPLHPRVDARAGILTLGRAPDLGAITGRVSQIPFVLTFPGLSLVTRPGVPPVAVESRAARALLRGTRWQIDAAQSTVVVER
jgi:hypothetical protein